MGKNQVAPAMVCSKAVAGREITAQLPFSGAYFVLYRGYVHGVLFGLVGRAKNKLCLQWKEGA